ncbi:DUF1569 domain-containing protein [Maribacter arenosus]|uniref:DUF1569 domain-containing protein n=1 Tax=Maribacter arenosus TaxID=1854708 RepID=A0ABR7V9K0_9FLAO|nr:DUF1569 domain-containing protein [Maribacter arenosus]MBD0850343.1 DUF1569 domain-containing protein [Maribacter arenosus]
MKTIFDQKIKEALIERIEKINETDQAQWGKMNVYQMVRHNTYWNGWILGQDKHSYTQSFMGKLFGKRVLKNMVKDEKPLDKNIPTSVQFKVKEISGDLDTEKAKWISLIKAFDNYDNPDFVHDFFGKMTKEQIGILAYKHTDHHLRQFGA